MAKEPELTNKKFAETNEFFQDACKRARVPSSKRQASRFRMKKGLAWKFRERKETKDA